VVGLCRDQILLFDPYFAKNQQGVCTGFVDWCLFGCFAASSAVASLTFFARPFACGLLRTWRISPPPHTTLIDFLVAWEETFDEFGYCVFLRKVWSSCFFLHKSPKVLR